MLIGFLVQQESRHNLNLLWKKAPAGSLASAHDRWELVQITP